MLVAVGVLALVVVFVSRLVSTAATITTLGHKRMDTDSQARQLFDRMAIDVAQMVKRTDVSYYLKAGNSIVSMNSAVDANDRMAFFSANPGYYSSSLSYNSNASLIAYRVNANNISTNPAFNKVERMGKGLALNGAYSTAIPLLFLDSATAPTTTIGPGAGGPGIWPNATSSTTSYDPDGEIIGPNVFRLEYYFLTKDLSAYAGGAAPSLVAYPTGSGCANGQPCGQLSQPTTSTGASYLDWTTVDKINIKDVSAVVVAIAAIDSKSRLLLTNAQIAILKGKLVDFTSNWVPGQLLSTWQTALNTDPQIAAMPRPAIQGVRLYERYFYLNQ
jgi:hypothetical protein